MEASKIKFVAIYVRKSRDNSESLEGQLASNIDFCQKFGWEYEVFREEGSASSEDWHRPELQKMIKRIEAQHYDGIVVTEQSRITRADEFPRFRSVLQEADCLFITTQTNSVYDYTKPEDEFVSDIMSAVNKQEIAVAKLRLKRGMIYSAKKGNYVGKKIATGYKYNKETKRLEITEDAPVIKRLFESYVDGMSTKEIAYAFANENVYTSTGIIWTPSGVTRMLSNAVYAGHSLYARTSQKKKNGKRITKVNSKEEQILVKNTHEPIVSQELFDEVQKLKFKRNSRPPSLKLAKHKFSSLIVCGLCGKTHSFQTSRYKRKRITSCQTRYYDEYLDKYTLCNNEGCNLTDFENEFYPKFNKYVNELKNHIDLIKQSEGKLNVDYDSLMQSKERQIKKIKQDIKRVQQGFIMKIFDESEAQEQIVKFKQQQEILENEIKELNQKNDESNFDYLDKVLDKIKIFMSGGDTMPEREVNEILKELIKAILYEKTDETNHEVKLKIMWKDVV